jgi:hypothetical protein
MASPCAYDRSDPAREHHRVLRPGWTVVRRFDGRGQQDPALLPPIKGKYTRFDLISACILPLIDANALDRRRVRALPRTRALPAARADRSPWEAMLTPTGVASIRVRASSRNLNPGGFGAAISADLAAMAPLPPRLWRFTAPLGAANRHRRRQASTRARPTSPVGGAKRTNRRRRASGGIEPARDGREHHGPGIDAPPTGHTPIVDRHDRRGARRSRASPSIKGECTRKRYPTPCIRP